MAIEFDPEFIAALERERYTKPSPPPDAPLRMLAPHQQLELLRELVALVAMGMRTKGEP